MTFDVYKQNMIMFSDKYAKERTYWNEKINSINESIFICDNMNTNIIKKEFRIDGEILRTIKKMCKNSPLTYYTLIVSVFQYVLSRYTGEKKIHILSPILKDNTKIKEINDCVIINGTLNLESRFSEFLKEILREISISNKLSNFPIVKVIDDLKLKNENSNIGEYIVVCKNIHEKIVKTNFQLLLEMDIREEEILLELFYRDNKSTINILNHISNVLKEFVNNPNIKLKDIKMLSFEEEKLLINLNGLKADYPKDKTITDLFEKQVEKTPDNIAVVFEDKKLTYRELNEKANQLARILRDKGVKADSIVGIMVERSVEMIIGIMAILKSGGTYFPIDTVYPKERIEYMLKDSKSNILLTTQNLLNNIEFSSETIDLLDGDLFDGEVSNLEKINKPNDLIYVIYTSGTTGNPKGTMVKHQSFTNLMKWYCDEFKISEKDNVLLMASVSFDLAQKNIYAPLIVGGRLTLANKGIIDYEKINKIINENEITIINCAPSAFNPIVQLSKDTNYIELRSLKYVFLGGEPINLNLLNDWMNSVNYSTEIVNTYGPTECTDIATYYMIKGQESIGVPIGKPINNAKAYILGKDKEVLPNGVPGELYISGAGVSRGYLDKPELTAEKFIDNPFDIGTKMYKTGDLVRWLPDGNIEFLGRIDNQVKIRGFRIELSEIENRLLQNEYVQEVAVIVKEGKENEKYVCAYIVGEKEVKKLNLKKYLREWLPEYMIPTYFVQLEKMPLTSNGKLDKRALPKPNQDINLNKYEAPRSELEEKLSKIWSEVLGVEKVGVNDSFFELGGHSLKAIELVLKMHKELSIEVPIREIFQAPTINGTSKYIEKAEKSLYKEIKRVEVEEYYEASSAQKRMYILQQFDLQSIVYNMPSIIMVEGSLNLKKLKEAFTSLIRRHETLRTSFEVRGEQIVQRVHNEAHFKLEYKDGIVDVEEREKIINGFIRPFDLSEAPLLRVGVIKLEKEKHILMYDMHHIISDGISIGIFIDEFLSIYEGKELDSLIIQYKDYSKWQNDFLKSDEMKKQEEYWLSRFSNEIPVLNMPIDFARPLVQSFDGENISFKLDKELTKSLKKIAKEAGCTMYMIFLSAINILLSKYSGQEDIIIGTPVAGRQHADLEKVIGMFVNTLAMRNYPTGKKRYEEFLKEVKDNALKAYENQDYQFEELVNKLSINRDRSRNPLFDVMLTMESIDNKDIKIRDLTFKGYKNKNKISKFDLTFVMIEINGEFVVNIEYCITILKKETIEKMLEHFINILKVIVVDKNVKLCEIEMISENDKHKLTHVFNDTFADYPKNKTIQELFEQQVEKGQNNIALIFKDKELTYKNLNEKSNSLARILRSKGVRSDDVVGIITERCPEMIIGILAILKAGGAYLPIDSSYPPKRIEYMLKDSKSKILLTKKNLGENIEFIGEVIDLFDDELFKNESSNLEIINHSSNLAYIIYTSGTTGQPKGVKIKNSNLINFLYSLSKQFITGFGHEDRILSLSNYGFDVSVCEFFIALTNGSILVINDKHKTFDPMEISRLIINNKITFTFIPPSLLQYVYKELEGYTDEISLNKLLVGVEPITGKILRNYYNLNKNLEIVNGYGPSEATICSTFYKVRNIEIENKAVPIGKPISNTNIYILNKSLNKVPIGVSGEICISGECLSPGYINNLNLTTEKFIDNSFKSGTKMYRTGDLGRWLPDGNIEFLGRADQQVKIRGFRIELCEIEKSLLDNHNIKEAVVIDREDNLGTKYLCAYLVKYEKLNIKEVIRDLSEKLPEYMIPSYFIELDKIPLNNSGKIDRRALPEPNGNITIEREYEGARNETEKRLVEIYEDVLSINKIGIYDNFFEIGGNSIKSIALANKINKVLGVNVSITDIFKNNCIFDLAKFISNKNFNFINKYEKVKLLKDSSEGNNLFFIHDGSGEITSYIGLVNKLNDNYKYLGIDAEEISVGFPIDIRIEELSKRYIDYIKSFQKNGPYNIAGWSLGGVLAFEVCRQLEEQGEEVKKLILIDSYIAETKSFRIFKIDHEIELLEKLLKTKIDSDFKNIGELYESHKKAISSFNKIELYTNLKKFYLSEVDELIYYWQDYDNFDLVRKFNLIRTLIQASNNYYPKNKVNSSIDYIKAIGTSEYDHNIWEKTTFGSVKYVPIKGNHFSIFNNYIDSLANEIINILER